MINVEEFFNEIRASISASLKSGIAITAEQVADAYHEVNALERKLLIIIPPKAHRPPTAAEFLQAGIDHMLDRAVTYDSAKGERSMAKTVGAFNIYTDRDLSEEEGWLFMNCLKKARSLQGEFKADNYEDDASYCGLRGECAARDRK